jgi:trk system potassium uptake protein TrkH
VHISENIKARYHGIFSYTGLILIYCGVLMFSPLLVLLKWPTERGHCLAFIIPAALLTALGIFMRRMFRPKDRLLSVQEAGVIVVLCWIFVCVFSAWPFMVIERLNFTQAVFESVSGYTTTGLSVVDVTRATHLILLWRSITQLVGGGGLVIIMLAAITGPTGGGLSSAEGRTEQLVPHVRNSARLVAALYLSYAALGIVGYYLAGMSVFDAVNHSFTAVATGGFSTKPNSIEYFNSPAIEAASIPLMLLGATNFILIYQLIRGKPKPLLKNGEIHLVSVFVPLGMIILMIFVFPAIYPSLGKSFRVAIFECVSALTGTGFQSTTYGRWTPLGLLVLTILMLTGGGTCSTAGGIKQYRIYLMFKAIWWEFRKPFLPKSAVVEHEAWLGENQSFINDRHIRQAAIYIFIYILSFIAGSAILSLAQPGYGFDQYLFEFASAQGNVGLSTALTRPNSPPVVLWTETVGMFLGRLEFFVIFVSAVKLGRDFYGIARGNVERIRSRRAAS